MFSLGAKKAFSILRPSSQPAAPAQPSAAPPPSQPATAAAVVREPESPPPPKPVVPGAENRSAVRRPASSLPAITGMRVSPHGVDASLINISESGVLADCDAQIKPGSSVTVIFDGTFTPRAVDGRVARCVVSSMGAGGRLRYHVGIAFAKRIALVPADTAAPATPEPTEAPAPPAKIVRNRW